jgi:lysophospholipase L1-like esterase
VAWAFGVQPLTESEDYQHQRSIHRCRLDPAHLAQHCPGLVRRSVGRAAIYAFGGSSMKGHPPDDERTITYYLQAELDRAHPDAYVVHNFGIACKDSTFVRHCVERAIRQGPELIVIYSGHNDFSSYLVPYPRVQMFVSRNPWLFEVRNALSHTRLFTLLSSDPAWVPPMYRGDPTWDHEGAAATVLDAYEANLNGIVDVAERHQVPVILVTLVSNLFEFPFKAHKWDRVLERIRANPSAPRWQIHYANGIELARGERFAEAILEFKRSRDLFYPSQRAPGVLNERIRELAAAHDGVHLVDFERELEALGREEGIGCNFFLTRAGCDGVHPSPRTNELIGGAIFRKVEDLRASATER